MDAFTIEIAGLVTRVQPLFQSTREYCRPYLTEKEPSFCVEVSAEDLTEQQMLLEREAVEEGLKIRKFKDPFLERATIQRRIADRLVLQNTLMMHGSCVAVDGKAYLFTAPCGTGKSTHTRLWREVFGQRAIMVNDDMPFLQITPEGVLAYGSPWSGKHGLATNACVPLKGICWLHRGKENVIARMDMERGIPILRHQVHTPEDPALEQRTQCMVDVLAQKVPVWEMYCNKDREAALASHGAMSAGDA